MSETANVADLLKITSRLITVLEREIEMLRAMRPSEIQALQEDKIVLTAAYEARVTALRGDPAAFERIAPALRKELKAAIAEFQTTLTQNESALRAAKETTDQVLHAIAAEIHDKSRAGRPYASQGGAKAGARAGRDSVCLTLNQSV
jgi:hypothetical protein